MAARDDQSIEVVSSGDVQGIGMVEMDFWTDSDSESDPDELVTLDSYGGRDDPGQPCIQIMDECPTNESDGIPLSAMRSHTIRGRSRAAVLSQYLDSSQCRRPMSTIFSHRSTIRSCRPSHPVETHQELSDEARQRKELVKNLTRVSKREGVCMIRGLPLSMDEKRHLRREVYLDVEGPSSYMALHCSWFRFALSGARQHVHLSTLWRGTLKRVGAHFGTGVLSYFLFVRTLLLYNSIMALLVGLFVVLPQATQGPELPPARQNFSGLELLSGEGYFTNSLMYYGYYTNTSLREAGISQGPEASIFQKAGELGYSIPLAYLFIVIISFFITCVMLVYSLSKSMGKSLQSEGGLTVWFFGSWDFKVTKKSSILLKQASILTQLKERISERMARNKKGGWMVRVWQLVVCGLVWIICLSSTGICVLGIYLYVKYIHLEKVKNVLGLPFLVSLVNLVLPGLFRATSRAERYQSPSTQAYVAILRHLLLKSSILSVLSFHWMTDDHRRLGQECWETYIGQELYRHVVTDLVMTLLHTLCGEFLWSQCVIGVRRRDQRPVFDIARNVLDLIYGQTLAWAGVLFSPLLPAVQILKLLLLFYIKKASLLLNHRPSHQLWRANRMSTVFTTLLCFPAFTGVAGCVAYTMWTVKPSLTCGPFRSRSTMFSLESEWEELKDAHYSLAWLSVVYTHLLKKPIFLYIIATLLLLVIYINKQRNEGQKRLISLLKKQIRNEGEDTKFLISKLNTLHQEHQE
ncbi:transmembrane channel-like protein 6 [Clupea harengus]|uniref:Transmembrane channel-like protein n=1 Tax=Clupea harengus TaxID=7950 RepID=A0A6P8F437_CLUHA|nr:transmembrane channel-like protein 6 [Clupea harengus]